MRWIDPLLRIASVLGVLVVASSPAMAQPVSERTLARAEAILPSDFTSVTSVRELGDGRLVVLDLGAGIVQLVDARLTIATPIGRHGQGPGEYRSPTRLFALQNDSSAIRDWGNTRLLVILPDASPGGTLDVKGGRGCEPWVSARAMPYSASDTLGRFYAEAEGYRHFPSGDREQADSAAIERWSTPCRADTLGYVPAHHDRAIRPEDMDPFPAPTQWAVAPDGRVAIVRPDPYRVDMVSADGRRQDGAPVMYERVRMTDAVKRGWREEQNRPQAALTITRGTGAVATAMTRKPWTEPARWPAHLPPFLRDAVRFATDGRLWVQRAVGPADLPLYDVFDHAGALVERVRLPARARIVGFGKKSVYLIRRSADDLEFLERHRLP